MTRLTLKCLLLFMLSTVLLMAEDKRLWSDWESLDGVNKDVQIRIHRSDNGAEGWGDGKQQWWYEIKNIGSRTYNVYLSFWSFNGKEKTWIKPSDKIGPPIRLAQGEVHENWAFYYDKATFDYLCKLEVAGDGKPQESNPTQGESNSENSSGSIPPSNDEVWELLRNEPASTFNAVVCFTFQESSRDFLNDFLKVRTTEPGVILIQGNEFHQRFDPITGIDLLLKLSSWFNNIGEWRMVSLTQLTGRPAIEQSTPAQSSDATNEQGNDDVLVPGSVAMPAEKDGQAVEAKTLGLHHEGYWLDPTDKDSHIGEKDPVIYVRLNGKAERTRLSEAKSKYGVPASANRDTMTLYSEETKDVLLDRGTHRK